MTIKLGDPPFLSLLLFFASSEVSVWTEALSSSSLSKLFASDWAGYFSSFLESVAIFSSCSLMCASSSSLFLMSRSSMEFRAAISSSKLFVTIVMTCMTMILEDLALVSDWKSYGEEESLL